MRKIVHFILLTLFVITAASCGNRRKSRKKDNNKPQTEAFVWVENGVFQAPIIVRSDISPRTEAAVNDLVNYVEKISGAKPVIIKGAPKPIPNKAVWIGLHDEFKSIFPNIKTSFTGEEIVICSNSKHLAIFGNDELQLGFRDVVFQGRTFPNAQKSYGTINAIYTFLQDDLGVRWFWPGELGEDYPSSKSISIPAKEFRYIPQMTWRSGIIMTSRPGWNKNDAATDLWTQRQRMFYSSDMINGGHPFNDWWEKYNQTHPEIFALNEKGNRQPIIEPRTVKLCVTNENVVNLWLKEVESMLLENPYTNIFSVNENDSYNQGHCTCDNCRKLDQVSVTDRNKNLSDRHIAFANKMIDALAKKYPNRKDFRVLYFAYGNNRPLPLKEKLDPRAGVVSVANFHLRRKSKLDNNEPRIKEYLDWSKMSDLVFWRPNIGNPVGFRWGLPDVAFNQIFEDFKLVADNKCKGVFFDAYPLHWSTQGIQYYLASQLSWNPNLNKEAALNDYFARLYGPAKTEMREVWEMCENTRSSLFDQHGEEARFFIHQGYNEAWFQKVKTLLATAKQKTKNGDKKFFQRIEFAESGLIYTEKIVSIRQLMSDFEKNGSNSERIDDLWGEIAALTETTPRYAINFKDIGITKKKGDEKKQKKFFQGIITNSPYTPPKEKKNKSREEEEGLE